LKLHTLSILLGLAFHLAASPETSSEVAAGSQPSLPARVAEFIEPYMARQQVPGLSLAIVKDGNLVLARAFGRANVELNVAATAEPFSRFNQSPSRSLPPR
jgi:CubicO group peptidase (beta-lactamase class C family)